MKLPVTQAIVEQVLREAHEERRLARTGLFAKDTPTGFCGCAVGNLLYAASGKSEDGWAIQDACEELCEGADFPSFFASLRHGDRVAREAVAAGEYTRAISAIFESRYTHEGHGGDIDSVIAGIREILPSRFMLDIDGLRALPTWRKRKPKAKRSRKAVRK